MTSTALIKLKGGICFILFFPDDVQMFSQKPHNKFTSKKTGKVRQETDVFQRDSPKVERERFLSGQALWQLSDHAALNCSYASYAPGGSGGLWLNLASLAFCFPFVYQFSSLSFLF